MYSFKCYKIIYRQNYIYKNKYIYLLLPLTIKRCDVCIEMLLSFINLLKTILLFKKVLKLI